MSTSVSAVAHRMATAHQFISMVGTALVQLEEAQKRTHLSERLQVDEICLANCVGTVLGVGSQRRIRYIPKMSCLQGWVLLVKRI